MKIQGRKRYQFIWWPRWYGVRGRKQFTAGLALVYEWSLMLGWLEIRKWRTP